MTEDEAKTKWCPHRRIGEEVSGGIDAVYHYAATNNGARCIGSGCMMWRWEYGYNPNLPIDHAPIKTDHGHCGLAGKP